MLNTTFNLIHENEAILSQVRFLKNNFNRLEDTSSQKGYGQEAIAQLIQTIYYLREGLEDFYRREDDLLLQLESSDLDQFKYLHRTILDSLKDVCRLLIGLKPERLKLNTNYLLGKFNLLYFVITKLNSQENEILKSHVN